MKSIFIGNDTIFNVYTKDIMQQLSSELDMDTNLIITQENINENKAIAAQAEFAFSTWGMPTFTEAQIEEFFPNLKAVFYAAGSVQGFARPFINRGIKVFSAWHANGIPVAEYTVAQIILANKGFFQAARLYNDKNHKQASQFCSSFPGNYGAKVGIIGAGVIGRAVIQMLKTYNLKILVFDPFLSEEAAIALGVTKCSLEELFSQCQTISNHLANNPQTVGMLNYELFSLMKNNATFINTGRGAQVVEADLAKILSERPNTTALLDVTIEEPLPKEHPFYSLPNLLLTPHIAGSMNDEVGRMAQYMADELVRLLYDKPTLFEVTAEMLKTMA